MATARSIKDAVVSAISVSAELISKCLDYYDAAPVFISGGSGRQGADSVPALAVLMWSRTAGEDDERRSFELSVLLSVTDETITTTTETVVLEEGEGEDPDVTQDVTIETYAGPDRLEELLEYVAAALLTISSEITIGDLTYSFEPLEYYPLFVGGIDFTVSYPRLLGGYEPTIN